MDTNTWLALLGGLAAAVEYYMGIWLVMREWYRKEEALWKKVAAVVTTGLGACLYGYNTILAYVSAYMVIVIPVICMLLWLPSLGKKTGFMTSWAMFYMLLTQTLRLVYLTAESARKGNGIVITNFGNRTVTELIVPSLIIGVCFWIMYSEIDRKIALPTVAKNNAVVFLLASIAGFFFMCYIMSSQRNQTSLPFLALNLMMIAMILISLLYLATFSTAKLLQSEKQEFLVQREWMEKYYEESRERFEEQARFLHDVKKERQYILYSLENHDTESVLSYLREEMGRKDSTIITHTGIPVLDFLIHQHSSFIQNHGIRLTVSGSANGWQLPLPASDSFILFGNLLDNAIEAVQQCEEGQRWVTVEMNQHNNIRMIKISNSVKQAPIKRNGQYISSKKKSLSHGWGLINVQAIAEENHIHVRFLYQEGQFEVTLYFSYL